jgi:RNA polymerase sigma-70 factor, ECF subfamily
VSTGAVVAFELEHYRPKLTQHCCRILGSSDAEDAVQETMVRAWRGFGRFEGRSGLGTWLHCIATNVCLDMLQGRRRRPLLVDMASAVPADLPLSGGAAPEGRDPAELTATREAIRHAFVAALQRLPPRQRAVLILRDVLRWRSGEVAELLGTTVAAVNSALQRARATLGTGRDAGRDATEPSNQGQRQLLDGYVDAFAHFDVDRLMTLLAQDASQDLAVR